MVWRPVIALLLLAPYLGEVLSTATSPLNLLVPWKYAMFAALYGSGALLCREVARRWGLGLPGLILLGMAYAVYEEALVDRYWFDPAYARDTGVGAYSEVWDTNLLLATHLTAFHTAVSICSSILIVTWLFPDYRDRSWIPARGLVVPAIAMLTVLFLTTETYVRPPRGPVFVAIGIGVLLVVAAFYTRRLPPLNRTPPARPRPRLLALVALVCAGTHFTLVYAVPAMGMPWPVGLVVTLIPLVVGALAVWRWITTGPFGHDSLWVVTGIIAFFIGLNAYAGLGGRYDLSIGALLLAAGLVWLHRRVKATDATSVG
ncbi:hypothetical protein JOF56_009481 [Kibdelosporangium banguiense]|uniref:DUF998 domain-containing protein n=1 Tax=Kibdelosporangium banguiense TaxID=1365924 RepID=A0ABS4TYV6_9PSEU|nr:hypothetical protein [Kibdelosporangium banguiense]MBP2329096.1 hypothetical protein [Kibdelosporangium banguiense]